MARVRALVLAVAAVVALGCGEGGDPASPRSRPAAAQPVAATPAARRPPPMPSFEGRGLEGERLRAASLLGRRALLFFFNPGVKEAAVVARAVGRVASDRNDHNFAVMGVALAADRKAVQGFVAQHGLDFPILHDTAGDVARRFRLRAPVALVGVDAEGRLAFGMPGVVDDSPDPSVGLEAALREALRLPAAHGEMALALGERPRAPAFRAETLDGGELALEDLRGDPVVLIFFLHTCPHCHAALGFLRDALAEMPEASRPKLVGVSTSNRSLAVRERLRAEGLDFFPVVFDPDHAVRSAYGVLSVVPEIFLIDARGFVVARNQGWLEERHPPILRMRLARLAGLPVPMLLHATGYSGSEVCGVCHQVQHETWQLTSHASAFDTLVRHGADANGECVGCHVVGHGERGGFESAGATPHLEDVGCESCHARGGPHLSPGAKANGSYEETCLACHDTKHSLGFEYARFLPRVSHAANVHLARLSLEEKRRLLEERGRPRTDLLPETAAHVGSDACQSCHPAEYETWSGGAHAKALRSLEQRDKADDAACLACHVTAYGRPGGFPKGGDPAAHTDLARVGCESCHGPGGDHVAAEAPKRGTIVSLGDKCDSCVILQICGSCHDEANDPGFEFAVQEKIEAQRHGTIEASATRDREARRTLPDAARLGLLERALASDRG